MSYLPLKTCVKEKNTDDYYKAHMEAALKIIPFIFLHIHTHTNIKLLSINK